MVGEAPSRVEVRGAVDVAVIGDGNTVTVTTHGQQRAASFLAPTWPSQRLVGRRNLRARLRQLIDGGCVSLHGLPGVGKTALALDLAYDEAVLSRFSDGVLWAGLGVRADIMTQLSIWAEHVGASVDGPGERTVRRWSEAIHRAIGARHYLLVIDDAWDPDHALAFQVGGPNCAHVLTTRLPSVALEFGGPVLRVDELGADDGLDLLEALAGATVQADRAAGLELVRLVGGLPLALVLIGHHLSQQAAVGHGQLGTAVGRLRASETRLGLRRRQAPAAAHPSIPHPVPLSLLAAMDVGYELLPGAARGALCNLSAFPPKPNTFSEPVARAITGVDAETLSAVLAAGLIEPARGGRYTMHQVVHDYARSKGDAGVAERRLVTTFVAILTEAEMTSEQFERDVGNVLAALDSAYAHGMHQALLRGMDATFPLLAKRGLHAVAQPHLEHALEAARAAGDKQAEARTLMRLGSVVLEQGDLRQGESYLVEGLRRAQEADATAEIVALLIRLGWATGMRGDLERARRHFGDALLGAVGVEAIPALQGLGWIAGLQGRHDDARTHLQRGLELAREAEDAAATADLLQVVGWMRVLAGDYPAAEEMFTECLTISRAERLGTDEIDALHGLGVIATQRGRYHEARSLLSQALTLAREVEYHEELPILVNLGRTLSRLGDLPAAEQSLREAVPLARQHDRPEKLSDALRELGRVELARGSPEHAEPHLRECLTIAERIATREPLTQALHALGELELARGRIEPVRELLERAIRLERGNPAALAPLRLTLGEAELRANDPAAATVLFGAALAAAERTGQEELAALSLYGSARALSAAGDTAAARRVAEDSTRRLRSTGSRHADEVARWAAGLSE